MKNYDLPSIQDLQDKIYLLRGENVMLDRDLAILYQVKATRLREQIKRNKEKFPEHFMFQLTEVEVQKMVSQNAIPSKKHLGGHLPYVFTEYGVLQLANVLRGDRATHISIKLIEIFITMRNQLEELSNASLQIEDIKKKLMEHDEDIKDLFDFLKMFVKRKGETRTQIGFKK